MGDIVMLRIKTVFLICLIISSFGIIVSCGKKNPTSSSTNEGVNSIDFGKISFSVVSHEDTIPTAFLNYLANKLEENENGLVKAKIINSNNIPIQLKFSVKIDPYTNESTQTTTVGANSTKTLYSIPIINEEQFIKINPVIPSGQKGIDE